MTPYKLWCVAAVCVVMADIRTVSVLHTAGHYLFLALLLAFALRLLYVTITDPSA